MNLKNKFCRSFDPATFTPPLTKIPGSAPVRLLSSASISKAYLYLIHFCHFPNMLFHFVAYSAPILHDLEACNQQNTDYFQAYMYGD